MASKKAKLILQKLDINDNVDSRQGVIAKVFIKLKENKKNSMYMLAMLLSVFLLTMSFYSNIFEVADDTWFREWQNDSEALVIGRLIRSRQAGLCSDYGLLQRDPEWNTVNRFLTDEHIESFSLYQQQIGLQGMLFGVLDRIMPMNGIEMLNFLYLLNSILLAILITLVAIWAWVKFGILSSIFIILGCIFSPWLVVSGRNLYWVTWTILLPFVAILYTHWIEQHSSKTEMKSWIFLIVAFFTIFIRVANGFEFTSAILISSVLPVIFYAIKENWNFRHYLRRSLYINIGGLGAFCIALIINIMQRSLVLGGLSYGLSSLQTNIYVRTGFGILETEVVNQRIAESLEASLLRVIHAYLRRGQPLILDYRMADLLLLFIIFILVILLTSVQQKRRSLGALAIVICASLSAPLSWIVLAKGHSDIHRHINYILWYFPGVILLFALCGATVASVIKYSWNYVFK